MKRKTFRCRACWLDPDYKPILSDPNSALVFEDRNGRQATGPYSMLRRALGIKGTDRRWPTILMHLLRGSVIHFPIDVVLTYLIKEDRHERNETSS